MNHPSEPDTVVMKIAHYSLVPLDHMQTSLMVNINERATTSSSINHPSSKF